MAKQPSPEQPDSTNSEWTVEDFRKAKLAGEGLTALFGHAQATKMFKQQAPASENREADAKQED